MDTNKVRNLHCHHKVSDHPVISKLICDFYLQCPSSHKQFNPLHVKHLLSLLKSWAPASSLTYLRLAWKTAALLALVTAKHFSNLILLGLDNQHLFLQHHAASFVPTCNSKMDQFGHLLPQIHSYSHFNVNLCHVFYLKTYVCHPDPFWKKLDGCHVSSLFPGNNRQHMPVCVKMICTWVRKVLCIAKMSIPLDAVWGTAASVVWWVVFPCVHPAGMWLRQSFFSG